MKHLWRIFRLWVLFLASSDMVAQVVTFNYNGVNKAIPDGDLSGVSDPRSVTTAITSIQKVTVSLTIAGTGSGAYNGDLYAYLQYGSGFSVLLNRPGKRTGSLLGYSDNGLNNVTFDDSASYPDVHNYRLTLSGNHSTAISSPGALTGTWASDGRNVNPGSVLDTDSSSATLDSFVGLNPNGTWTLFLADAEYGGTAQLSSWSLSITPATPVPEPVETALAIGLGLGAFGVARRLFKSRS